MSVSSIKRDLKSQIMDTPFLADFINKKEEEESREETIAKQKKLAVYSVYSISVVNLALLSIRFIWCFITLDRIVISNSLFYITLCILVPIGTWFFLTTQAAFKFHNRKWQALIVSLANVIMSILQILYTFLWDSLVTKIFKIRVTEAMTPSMILNLARLVEIGGVVFGAFILVKCIQPFLLSKEAKARILAFELNQIIDLRQDKEFAYDFRAAKNLKNSSLILVKEIDRFVHFLILGASGTGKTSSIYTSQICIDIDQKIKNLNKLQEEVYKLVKSGDVEITEPFEIFNKQYFKCVNPKKEKEFNELFKRYKDCGITAVSPDNGMNEDILNYCDARGIIVYNLDPTKDVATHSCERLCGLNPMYVPPEFHTIKPGDKKREAERKRYLHKAATNICEAIAAINELNGSVDPYFADVNYTAVYHLSFALMLAASINGSQTNMSELCDVVDEFALIDTAKKEITTFYGLTTISMPKEPTGGGFHSDSYDNPHKSAKEAKADLKVSRMNPYYRTLHVIETSLKPGGKMDEQAVGLRNLLGKIMQDPDIERMFVDYEDRPLIDPDEILRNNCITLVNTALELSNTTCTCFGQLFILNFNSAVLRRPKDTRTPHFFFQDESARYLSNTIDTMISLYRKYRVSCSFALQSLAQPEKSPNTRYLKDMMIDVGTLIAFGATNTEDSETVSALSGEMEVEMVQKTSSHSSVFSDNPNTSFSERTTPNMKKVIEEKDVRFRNFQEFTMITRNEGRVLLGQLGKASFVPKEAFKPQREVLKNNELWKKRWRNYFPQKITAMPVTQITTTVSESQKTLAEILAEKGDSITIETSAAIRPQIPTTVLGETVSSVEVDMDTQMYFDDDDDYGFSGSAQETLMGALEEPVETSTPASKKEDVEENTDEPVENTASDDTDDDDDLQKQLAELMNK